MEIQMQMMGLIDSQRSDSGFLNKEAVVAANNAQQQQQNYIAHHGMLFAQQLQQQPLTEIRHSE